MKITRYGVCTASTKDDIEQLCEDGISRGWIPQGGVSASLAFNSAGERQLLFCQAFIKVDDHLTSTPDDALIEFLENKD